MVGLTPHGTVKSGFLASFDDLLGRKALRPYLVVYLPENCCKISQTSSPSTNARILDLRPS